MATVTVAGSQNDISVPFRSDANAALAQQLANQISAAIKAGALYDGSGLTVLPALPTTPGGVSIGLQLIPTDESRTEVQNPTSYPVIINQDTDAVTVTGAPFQVAPYSILGGTGGLTFYGENSSLGGSIFVGGGQNVITGTSHDTTASDSTNGGLVGDWTIGTGSSDPADTDVVRLASGNDYLVLGANDTVATGAANAAISVKNTDAAGATVFLGTGNVDYFGGSEAKDLILGYDVATGKDVVVLGTGGNSTVAAGTGNATLVGGGNGDLMFGNPNSATQQLWASGNETLIGGGSSSDTFFGFSGIKSDGNAFMTAANGRGDNQFWAGAGNDTIWTGLGHDTVFVFADHTHNGTGPPQDLVLGWNDNSTLYLNGYSSANFTKSAMGVTLKLSDGTQVTFAGVTDPHAIKTVG